MEQYITVKRKRLKFKWLNFCLLILFIASTFILTYSVINLLKWQNDNKKTNLIIKEIKNTTEIVETTDTENTQIITPEEEIDQTNPYWDYIKINLLDVNFTYLKSLNNETVGWLEVKGTNINYPFVQTTNNEYYLNHSFDKSYNNAGWVFMDWRNSLNGGNKNTIIYAHGRQDKTMFGSLKNVLSEKWQSNPDNFIIRISTEYENTLWQIVSVYKIITTNDYIQTEFNQSNSFEKFTNLILSRSVYNFNTPVESTDQILTLSTCYDDDEKAVVHAKLIKKETKIIS